MAVVAIRVVAVVSVVPFVPVATIAAVAGVDVIVIILITISKHCSPYTWSKQQGHKLTSTNGFLFFLFIYSILQVT